MDDHFLNGSAIFYKDPISFSFVISCAFLFSYLNTESELIEIACFLRLYRITSFFLLELIAQKYCI